MSAPATTRSSSPRGRCSTGRRRPEATARFLASGGHHLFLAYDGATAVGMVTGVEMTHPDKGTEMFLYELGVAEQARGRGVGRALVAALAEFARVRGCYGMWVLTDDDNGAALATYRSTGAVPDEPLARMLTWDLTAFPPYGGGEMAWPLPRGTRYRHLGAPLGRLTLWSAPSS